MNLGLDDWASYNGTTWLEIINLMLYTQHGIGDEWILVKFFFFFWRMIMVMRYVGCHSIPFLNQTSIFDSCMVR